MSTAGGNKPLYSPSGEVLGPVPRNIMDDPRQALTLREALHQGVGKAHRAVVYAHYDFRNFGRNHLGTQGRIT
jgi:hypothetical protein